jgi:hypothetical protein
MTLNPDDIIELALQYVSIDEVTDFPKNNELFCFFERSLPENRIFKDDEGWNFKGYGICICYEYDMQSKPRGKWIWFSFLSLDTFPPQKQNIKLQPPHIVRGMFQTLKRTSEIKILNLSSVEKENLHSQKEVKDNNRIENFKEDSKTNILKFPEKR